MIARTDAALRGGAGHLMVALAPECSTGVRSSTSYHDVEEDLLNVAHPLPSPQSGPAVTTSDRAGALRTRPDERFAASVPCACDSG